MKTLIAAIITSTALAGSAYAEVLSFDDVPGGSIQGRYGDVGAYKDFAFSANLRWIDTVGSSYNYGAVSGDFTLLNLTGGTGVVTAADGSDFTFAGISAKRWATPPESGGADGLFGTLSGYRDGEEVWSIATALNGSFRFFGPQQGAIDALRLGFGHYFLADNLELADADTDETDLIVPVVVPAAFPLLLSGIGGLIVLHRISRRRARRRRRQSLV